MQRKILIMGLPGAGKSTLTRELALLINAVIFNADEVRANLNRDLGFSIEDRIEQARRMGWLCDQVVKAGGTAIADFVCPTQKRERHSALLLRLALPYSGGTFRGHEYALAIRTGQALHIEHSRSRRCGPVSSRPILLEPSHSRRTREGN